MGNLISSQMEAVVKKQMEFQKESMKVQLQRQIEMQNQMRIRMQAIAVARSRDMFTFAATFYGLLGIGLTAGAIKKRNPGMFFPLVPLSVPLGYMYDMAWGDKMPRIVGWAEEIIEHEPYLLGSPHGMPTIEDIERVLEAKKLSKE